MNPKDDSEVRTLRAEIRESLAVLERIEGFLVDYQEEKLSENPGLEEAMVVTQSLTNYYTCLETLFLRISRFFENSLDREQWHRSLLEKMTLEIEDFRPRVIGRDVYLVLLELLKFRHFARYYFELDYDWDKLRFLLKKFNWVRSEVRLNLVEFDRFLRNLLSK
jgi:hypothetical protein